MSQESSNGSLLKPFSASYREEQKTEEVEGQLFLRSSLVCGIYDIDGIMSHIRDEIMKSEKFHALRLEVMAGECFLKRSLKTHRLLSRGERPRFGTKYDGLDEESEETAKQLNKNAKSLWRSYCQVMQMSLPTHKSNSLSREGKYGAFFTVGMQDLHLTRSRAQATGVDESDQFDGVRLHQDITVGPVNPVFLKNDVLFQKERASLRGILSDISRLLLVKHSTVAVNQLDLLRRDGPPMQID